MQNKNTRYIIIGLVISLVAVLILNIFLLYQIRQDQISYENEVASLKSEIIKQQNDKNTIRNLWEEQAAQNDKLIIAQTNVINRINSYIATVENSIRFVNSRPELLPGASEERLKNAFTGLDTELKNLEEKTTESSQTKEESKTKVDALYLNSGEQQDNRANPRNEN